MRALLFFQFSVLKLEYLLNKNNKKKIVLYQKGLAVYLLIVAGIENTAHVTDWLIKLLFGQV